ncbi:dihydrolipoamide acetyltransferase family protein [Algiphilus sp.]|uniref:dihydrolipoamide acetyltransferase family protein n=1 Tax=Algiphilus sp. TaxID=1872431 RepID=UPI003B51D757
MNARSKPAQARLFKLPDLGEGLAEAELREWLVDVGDEVAVDQAVVSVETDKAVVEIPSPRAGRIAKLYAQPGDMVATGATLLAFHDGDEASAAPDADANTDAATRDAGAVVGAIERSDRVLRESAGGGRSGGQGVRAMPAVRALARKHGVDLAVVTPTGPDSLITAQDVERAARTLQEAGPIERLRGVRRAMARAMAVAHEEVADVTLTDDADIHDWAQQEDITLRLLRAIVAGCRAEPALNAWYDGHAVGRRLRSSVDVGIAVETEEGLFVPVLRDVAQRSPEDLRAGLEALKRDVRNRSIPASELRGHSFILSNFGRFGGKYANPMVLPPAVAILGAGRVHEAVVAYRGKAAVRRQLPLSLTFDHRAATGAEASRCLAAIIGDLEQD